MAGLLQVGKSLPSVSRARWGICPGTAEGTLGLLGKAALHAPWVKLPVSLCHKITGIDLALSSWRANRT